MSTSRPLFDLPTVDYYRLGDRRRTAIDDRCVAYFDAVAVAAWTVDAPFFVVVSFVCCASFSSFSRHHCAVAGSRLSADGQCLLQPICAFCYTFYSFWGTSSNRSDVFVLWHLAAPRLSAVTQWQLSRPYNHQNVVGCVVCATAI
jgi:hypothetical protein